MVVAKTASTAVQKKTADKDGCAEVRQVKGANILAYVIAFSVTILLHSVKVCVCVCLPEQTQGRLRIEPTD